jgi:outer membrane protein TolC
MRFILTILYIAAFLKNISAQSQQDSSKPILTLTAFLNLVKQNHPIVQQADLLNRTAQAELLAAKGGFDPKLYGDYEQKYFDSKNYFSFGEYGLKIPTWYGIEVKSSYNTATGYFINAENKLPAQGQAVLGVSLPLLQNLKLDERRANLFKARQAQGLYQTERDNITNDLAFEAAQIYWKWAFYHQQMLIFDNALKVANERFKATKMAFELGDRMAMDTLESFTQVQDRRLEYNNVLLEWQEIHWKLANFLWDNDAKPILNPQKWQPESLENTSITILGVDRNALIQNIASNHPTLKGYDFKIKQLEIDRNLKREKLKPKLNLQYNILGNGFNLNSLFLDNYKWGITFSTSTLFRAERGDSQLAALKIENTQLLKARKALELQNKLQQFLNETDILYNQITLYRNAANNYQQLLQLENTRFELGESSFFLINSRENKYLEAQLKLAKLLSAYQIARTALDWVAGQLYF